MIGSNMAEAIDVEYRCLLRMWGRLQSELSAQCQAHARVRAALEAEVIRLRAELLIAHTAQFWGMAAGRITRAAPQRTTPSASLRSQPATEEVLCRTGCEGHAHHWLDERDGCTRTGQPCHRLTRTG